MTDVNNEEVRTYKLTSKAVINNELKDADAITITKVAADHIRRYIEQRGAGIGIKVAIKEVGCSGMMYVVDFIDQVNDSDYRFPIDNTISIYVDQVSFVYLKGTEIDYVRKGLNENFEFYNPNSKSTCGCGESFTI